MVFRLSKNRTHWNVTDPIPGWTMKLVDYCWVNEDKHCDTIGMMAGKRDDDKIDKFFPVWPKLCASVFKGFSFPILLSFQHYSTPSAHNVPAYHQNSFPKKYQQHRSPPTEYVQSPYRHHDSRIADEHNSHQYASQLRNQQVNIIFRLIL